MPLSTYLKNKILDNVFGLTDYAEPATVYVGLHTATTLSSAATSGTNTISVVAVVSNGVVVVIDPDTATEETKTVTGVSGGGPYTLTLNSNLASNHDAGDFVKFEPGANGENIKPPTGAAYARISVTNNTTNFPNASGGQKSSGADFTFPSATGAWGTVTHLTLHDAASAGNVLAFGATTTRPALDATSNPISFPAGNILMSLT